MKKLSSLFFLFDKRVQNAFKISLESEKKILYITIFLSVAVGFVQIAGIGAFLPVLSIMESGNLDNLRSIPIIRYFIRFLPGDIDKVMYILIGLIFGVIILRAMVKAVLRVLKVKVKNSIDCIWQKKVLTHWINLAPYQHGITDRTEVMHLCAREVANIGRGGGAMIMFISAVIQIAIVSTFMLFISWKIFLILAGLVLFLIIPFTLIMSNIFDVADRDSLALKNYTRTIIDVIRRIDLVDIFSTHKFEIKKLKYFLKGFLNAQLDLQKARTVGPFFVEVVGAIVISAAIIYSFNSPNQILGYYQLVVLIGCFVALQPQLNMISESIGVLGRVEASHNRISQLLSIPQIETRERKHGINFPNDCTISFHNVSFSYRTSESCIAILNDACLTIPSGNMTMIFGASGAGKTTFLKLLMRLILPDSGKVMIGGYNSAEFQSEVWSRNVLMMPQDDIIFTDTIRENIVYGTEGANDH